MKKKNLKPEPVKQKNTYSLDDKARALKYYLIGLTLKEVGKLTDTPFRTIEKWYLLENWKIKKETEPIQKKVIELYDTGMSYNEISKLIGKSKATVYRYLKNMRNETNN